MSTKTTFKRIALVAVAALGFGMLSVVPSNAAPTGTNVWHGRVGGTGGCPDDSSNWTCWDITGETSWVLASDPASYGFVHSALANATDSIVSEWTLTSAKDVDGNVIPAYSVPIITMTDIKTTDAGLAAATGAFTGGNPAYAGSYLLTGTDRVGGGGAAVTNGTPAVSGLKATTTATAAGGVMGNYKNVFSSATPGTYVWTLNTAGATAHTWTVKVYATAGALTAGRDADLGVSGVVSASTTTSFINAGTSIAGAADAVVTGSKTANSAAGAQKATIHVVPANAAGTALVGRGVALTATISGGGTLAIANDASVATTAAVGRAITGAAEAFNVLVFADGSAGVSTVTISSGTTVLATETITFYGALASLKATASKTIYGSDVVALQNAGAAVADTYGVRLQGLDSAGVEVPLSAASVTVASSNVDAFESAAAQGAASDDTGYTGQLLVTVDADTTNGVGGATSVMTYTVGTISTTATLTYGYATVADTSVVTIAFDKPEYNPGEKATITVTAKDSKGKALADGVTTLAGIVASSSLSDAGVLAAATGAGVAGVKTYTVYMPLGVGTVTLTAALAGGLTGTSATATASVISDGVAQAAADAAAEATDAANAATDAANAAAEAADAATAAAQDAADAVAALSAQVADLIAGLKAQLTALTNLVIKIQKKVKA